eukprot:Skav215112  [mRNA]  locus=scaffold1893:181349:186727:+ [translate_table: standard]
MGEREHRLSDDCSCSLCLAWRRLRGLLDRSETPVRAFAVSRLRDLHADLLDFQEGWGSAPVAVGAGSRPPGPPPFIPTRPFVLSPPVPPPPVAAGEGGAGGKAAAPASETLPKDSGSKDHPEEGELQEGKTKKEKRKEKSKTSRTRRRRKSRSEAQPEREEAPRAEASPGKESVTPSASSAKKVAEENDPPEEREQQEEPEGTPVKEEEEQEKRLEDEVDYSPGKGESKSPESKGRSETRSPSIRARKRRRKTRSRTPARREKERASSSGREKKERGSERPPEPSRSPVRRKGAGNASGIMPKRHLEGATREDRAKQRKQLGSLKSLTVQPVTRDRYQKALDTFFQYLSKEGLILPRSAGQIDSVVADYLEHLWATGAGRSEASNTLAALQDSQPRLKHHLQQSWRLMKAWVTNEVPNRAPPLPLEVVEMMVGHCLFKGKPLYALSLLVAFHGLLRTGELLGLKASDVSVAKPQGPAVISLGLTKSGKRQGAAESIMAKGFCWHS